MMEYEYLKTVPADPSQTPCARREAEEDEYERLMNTPTQIHIPPDPELDIGV